MTKTLTLKLIDNRNWAPLDKPGTYGALCNEAMCETWPDVKDAHRVHLQVVEDLYTDEDDVAVVVFRMVGGFTGRYVTAQGSFGFLSQPQMKMLGLECTDSWGFRYLRCWVTK